MSETISYQEQMDACRPGSDDLRQPELADAAERIRSNPAAAAAFQRSQAWDMLVGEIVRGGRVPDGLAASIIETAHAKQQEIDAVSAKVGLADAARRQHGYRARWIWGLVSLAAVLGLMVAWGWRQVPSRPLTRSQLLLSVEHWIKDPGLAWETLTADQLQRFSLDSRVNFHPDRWQPMAIGAMSDAVVYSDRYAQRGSLYLFVVEIGETAVIDLPSSPPRTADWNSQGWHVGVWRRDHLVYALAVKGASGKDYRQLLAPVRIG
ncbi:MAG: hypothetical protein CMJ59_00845 [Planctomycetaceae bacterium]|nr:hypothetical protein [Planctomycetaceae bacterium]